MAMTLNPQLDVVFKLLFAAKLNRSLLLDLLNDVLSPPHRIASVTVTNPQIEKEMAADRGLALDILAVHEDGSRTNIEMQTKNRGATAKRALYHWARLYRDGVRRGDGFSDLVACRVIFFLSYRLLGGDDLHSTFHVLKRHDGQQLGNELEIHVVELPKLQRAVDDPELSGVEAWTAFLIAASDEERRRLSMHNPKIQRANEALAKLSQDEDAQAWARRRADELFLRGRRAHGSGTPWAA